MTATATGTLAVAAEHRLRARQGAASARCLPAAQSQSESPTHLAAGWRIRSSLLLVHQHRRHVGSTRSSSIHREWKGSPSPTLRSALPLGRLGHEAPRRLAGSRAPGARAHGLTHATRRGPSIASMRASEVKFSRA